MFDRKQIERAVDLQTRGYQLLRGLEKAFADGFIAPEAAGNYASSDEAAFAWLDRHYLNLPANARPARADLRTFSRFFSTYLSSTFDLDTNPGQQLYSPNAHCFCPLCSWLRQAPHLKPKKVGPQDKKLAERMKKKMVRNLAQDAKIPLSAEMLEATLQNPALRESIGLCAYAADLLQRLDGVTVGAASLALWRSFAWNVQGSPKKKFDFSADAILAAEQLLLKHLRKITCTEV